MNFAELDRELVMYCLLCGSESDEIEMHQLIFSIPNRDEFQRRFPDTDLDAGLRDVGICTDCIDLSQGQLRTLILIANKRMPNE